MIAPAVAEQVARLLAEGKLSQRRIATLLGISRASVDTIANRRLAGSLQTEVEDDVAPPGPAVRCPGCGGLVYPPCRLCRIRALKRRDRARAALRRRLQRPGPAIAKPSCQSPTGADKTHS